MLYLIGLGLGDEKDVTLKGLEAIKSADRVFLEAYTSILGVDQQSLVTHFFFFLFSIFFLLWFNFIFFKILRYFIIILFFFFFSGTILWKED